MSDELERLRQLNSEQKHVIHTLRKRIESLTRELEQLRAGQPVTPVVRHFDFTRPEPETE